jgi:heavy metal translocating P-type ATPase
VPAATAAALCDLCGLDAARQPVVRDNHTFCCAGCANVYAILEESGLIEGDFRQSELYLQSLHMGLISNAGALAVETEPIPAATESKESVYRLSGLWCASCAWLIEHALGKVRGVLSAEVVFTSDLLRVRFYPQYVVPSKIVSLVESLGYRAEPSTGDSKQAAADRRDLLLRTGIAAFLWMNVMLFSLVVYASYFDGVSSWAQRTIPPILMALTTPAIFYCARPILRIAWSGLKQGVIRMETLVATGILAAYLYSACQIWAGGKHFYFDTACAIVTLVLTGKSLERGAKEKTIQSLSLLHQMMPSKARVISRDSERFVSADLVTAGMTLLVKPGERIPADGMVVEGSTCADESILTGESSPLRKSVGDPVAGGSLNGAGVVAVRVTRAPAESTLSQILASVERSLATRTPLERTVDRVARYLVPSVMLLALAVAGLCYASGLGIAESLLRAIAVLVIACPCALGIATPLAATNAVGSASRMGVLLRDAGVLESAHKLDVMVLDKTGTVTEGKFRLQDAWWEPRWAERGPELLASLESVSEHPIGRMIAGAVSKRSIPRNIEVFEGRGISGLVEGFAVKAGSRRFVDLPLDPFLERRVAGWENQGFTVIYCSISGEIAGALALGDRVRADAVALVGELRKRGIRTVLLSGDSCATTACIAAHLAVTEYQGEMLPAQKAQRVESYRKHGSRVAVVGDGINDTPALAAADLGLAIGSGSDLAAYTAPVVLMNPSLLKIPELLDLARRTSSIIKQNLFWAFFYNTLGITLAATGVLNPILAAGAMVLSSLSVVGNSLRAR